MTETKAKKPTKAQRMILEALASGQDRHLFELQGAAILAIRTLVSSGLIQVSKRDRWGYIEMVRITDAGRAALLA